MRFPQQKSSPARERERETSLVELTSARENSRLSFSSLTLSAPFLRRVALFRPRRKKRGKKKKERKYRVSNFFPPRQPTSSSSIFKTSPSIFPHFIFRTNPTIEDRNFSLAFFSRIVQTRYIHDSFSRQFILRDYSREAESRVE